jgi:hypothetical protein
MSEYGGEPDDEWVHFEAQFNGGDVDSSGNPDEPYASSAINAGTEVNFGQKEHTFIDGIIPDQYAVTEEAAPERIAASDFDVSPFEGKLPQDTNENNAAQLAFEAVASTLGEIHADVFDAVRKMKADGNEATYNDGLFEISDEDTNVFIQLMLEPPPSTEVVPTKGIPQSSAIIIKTYAKGGAQTSHNAYYSTGSRVRKDVISLTPSNAVPKENEATEDTRLEMAAEYVRSFRQMHQDAKKAGLIGIPVSLAEVEYVAHFIGEAQPRTVSFNRIFSTVQHELRSPHTPDINAALEATPRFMRHIERHFKSSYPDLHHDSLPPVETIPLDAQPLGKVIPALAEAEIGYEQPIPDTVEELSLTGTSQIDSPDSQPATPYIKLHLHVPIEGRALDDYFYQLLQQDAIQVIPDLPKAMHRIELKIGVNHEWGYLELEETIGLYDPAGNPIGPPRTISRPTTPYVAGLARNFAKNPIFKTQFE